MSKARSLKLLAAGGLMLSLAACKPVALPNTPSEPAGEATIEVTVLLDGAPVAAADGIAMTGNAESGGFEQFETGPDGTATVSGPAGTWQLSAHGASVADPDDADCFFPVEDDATVEASSDTTTEVTLHLEVQDQEVCV